METRMETPEDAEPEGKYGYAACLRENNLGDSCVPVKSLMKQISKGTGREILLEQFDFQYRVIPVEYKGRIDQTF